MEKNQGKHELFGLCRLLMIMAGVWSIGEPQSSSKMIIVLYQAYSIGGQLYYDSCLIFLIIRLFETIKMGDIEMMVANLKSLTFVTTIIAKVTLCQAANIVKLLKSALDEEKNILENGSAAIKGIYDAHVKYCTKVVVLIMIALYVAGLTYLAEAIYKSYQFFQEFNYYNSFNETMAESLKKPHSIEFWYPFDKDKYYSLATTYECIHISQSIVFNGAAQALVNSAMIFLRAELKILQHYVSHYHEYPVNDQTSDIQQSVSRQTIKAFAIKHQEVIRWVQDFKNSFQNILLIEYCVISILLATALIELYQGEKVLFNVLFFLLCSMQLFILAWNANEIFIESSTGLMNSLYESNWYLEKEKQTKVFIRIMMMRCSKPLAISIGPFGIMTMNAAVSRMKLAYSVMSVLSNKK